MAAVSARKRQAMRALSACRVRAPWRSRVGGLWRSRRCSRSVGGSVRGAARGRARLCARSHDRGVEAGDGGVEGAAGVALVADHGLAAAAGSGRASAARRRARRSSAMSVRARVGCRRARTGVQPKALEEAAVAGAIAVVGGIAPSRAAPRRLHRAGALDRGAVDEHDRRGSRGCRARTRRSTLDRDPSARCGACRCRGAGAAREQVRQPLRATARTRDQTGCP